MLQASNSQIACAHFLRVTAKAFWGIESYQLFYYHIVNVRKHNEKANFRLIHFFYEHKKGIGNRLKFIQKILPIENIQFHYLKKVIKPVQFIRMHYLKDVVSNRNTFDEKKLKLSLEEIKQNEIQLLREVYQLLESYL